MFVSVFSARFVVGTNDGNDGDGYGKGMDYEEEVEGG